MMDAVQIAQNKQDTSVNQLELWVIAAIAVQIAKSALINQHVVFVKLAIVTVVVVVLTAI